MKKSQEQIDEEFSIYGNEDMGKYILQENIATKKLGKPIYLCKMTGIGPMTTDKIEEAMKFDSEQDAKNHQAYTFWLTDFSPLEVVPTK